MKIEKLKTGMTVYDVGRYKMGTTTMTTVGVWSVRIVEVDIEKQIVIASWNGNIREKFYRNSWSKWRFKKPKLITDAMGKSRLAKRGE